MPSYGNKHFNKIDSSLRIIKKTQQFRVVSLKLNFNTTIFNQHCFVLLFFCFFFLFFFGKFGKYILHTFADQMDRPIIDSMTLTSFTTYFCFFITSLQSAKAFGPYSIPVCLQKPIKTCISFPLQLIYNLSFSSGCVPGHFKLANVIPIHKKDSVTCMNNYRPISLLSIFNKILEKLVHKRLVNFIDKHNTLYVIQFSFSHREKHSTMHATLLITDKIQTAVEDGLFSCGIFLDFSKAFDTVDHSI